MPVTPDDLKEWLGDDWRLRTERVAVTSWRRPRWRGEYLSRKARLGLHHVYDAPNIDRSFRSVVFALRRLR